MSGRIRQLKPDFHMDEEFWALMSAHPDMFLDRAFEGLWCHSDREGRFEWRPQMLKAKILPYWSGDFAAALELLADAGYVVSYEVDGRRYGWVRSFAKHQRPNSREPESSIPPPPFDSADVSVRARAREDASPRASLPPLPIPNSQHPNPTRSSGVRAVPEVPGLERVAGGGVARTYTMPSKDPPKEYLDVALMGGVGPAQARSTWKHYWGAGLPTGGVERLHDWLTQRAAERAAQTASLPRARARESPGAELDTTGAATAFRLDEEHRAFGRRFRKDVDWAASEYRRGSTCASLDTLQQSRDFMNRIKCWEATGTFHAEGPLPKPVRAPKEARA